MTASEIALADVLKTTKPIRDAHYAIHQQWNDDVLAICRACQASNPSFDRFDWLAEVTA